MTADGSDPVAALLQAELQTVSEFVSQLQLEQAALQNGDTESLTGIADIKAQLTNRLNEIAIRRNQALANACFPADREGIQKWLEKQPPGKFDGLWEKLRAGFAEARELNELNGKLITMRMQYINQALNTLLTVRRQNEMLYGPDGHPSQFAGRRIIDAA